MQVDDEKRDYMRMPVDCEMYYKLADSSGLKAGRCKNLSGAGMCFITDQAYDIGLAMEVRIPAKAAFASPMIAYIEIIRSARLKNGTYETGAVIRSIKGN